MEGWESLERICKLVYPDAGSANKVGPHCIKIAKIGASCEPPFWPIWKNAVAKESKGAFSTRSVFRGVGDFEGKRTNSPPQIYKPNGMIWKKICDLIRIASLEWIRLWRYLNMDEFNLKRANGGS